MNYYKGDKVGHVPVANLGGKNWGSRLSSSLQVSEPDNTY